MSDWRELPLGECLSTLIDYRGKSPKKSETGIPVISAKVVKDGRITHPIVQKIAPSYYVEWMRRGLPRVGDVVLTTEGPLGEVAQLDDNTAGYALGQRIVVLRAKENILDNNFLKFLLQSPVAQTRLQSYATGTTVAGISQQSLRRVPLPIPPLQQQRDVAELLGSLDDKIELNRRMNETLEAMAQAIFRDWFVDFGPTRRKLEGATDPATIMGGLVTDPARAQELADLFPATLGDDGLPEGWREGDLGDYASLNPENISSKNKPSEVEYVDLSNTKWGVIENTTRYRWQDAPSRARRVVRCGDTLVGTVRPGNGSYSFVGVEGLTASTGFAVLRPQTPELAPLVYLGATSISNIARLEALADGGAYPAVKPETVLATPVPVPDTALAYQFGQLTSL